MRALAVGSWSVAVYSMIFGLGLTFGAAATIWQTTTVTMAARRNESSEELGLPTG